MHIWTCARNAHTYASISHNLVLRTHGLQLLSLLHAQRSSCCGLSHQRRVCDALSHEDACTRSVPLSLVSLFDTGGPCFLLVVCVSCSFVSCDESSSGLSFCMACRVVCLLLLLLLRCISHCYRSPLVCGIYVAWRLCMVHLCVHVSCVENILSITAAILWLITPSDNCKHTSACCDCDCIIPYARIEAHMSCMT